MLLYPINLDIKNRLCIIVGGGTVALRKTRGLLTVGARVRIISPRLVPELLAMASSKEVEWLDREYVEGDIKEAFLGFAVTDDPAVQKRVLQEADKFEVLLNSGDDPQNSSFHLPAHFRRGKLLVTISTGGGSPALAKQLKEKYENDLGEEYGDVVELLAAVRNEVVGKIDSDIVNGDLFHTLLANDLVGLVMKKDWFELQMMLIRELPDNIDAVEIMKKFQSSIGE